MNGGRRRGMLVLLQQPVSGNAVMGDDVHGLVADPQPQRALGMKQHGMQSLVAIGHGDGDVVLEPAGHRFIKPVQDAQCPIAAGDSFALLFQNHIIGVASCKLFQGCVAQVLVDAVQADGKWLDSGCQSGLMKRLMYGPFQPPGGGGPGSCQPLEGPFQAAETPRMKGLEAAFLHFGAEVRHAQPARDGCMNVQGLTGDAPAPARGQCGQCAHVVQSVGQLDEDDPDVSGHGQHHFLEVFSLSLGSAAEFNLVQAADAVHQLGHHLAKTGADELLAGGGVLDGVVKQGGNHALAVHAQLRKNVGNRQRVADIGFTAGPLLPPMRLAGIAKGLLDPVQRRGTQVFCKG